MKDITTEKAFLGKLRIYYRKCRRLGFDRDEISFLGLMEYTGTASSKFMELSDKYFSFGPNKYNWSKGNRLLQENIDEWDKEIDQEKTKKAV